MKLQAKNAKTDAQREQLKYLEAKYGEYVQDEDVKTGFWRAGKPYIKLGKLAPVRLDFVEMGMNGTVKSSLAEAKAAYNNGGFGIDYARNPNRPKIMKRGAYETLPFKREKPDN